MLQALSEELLRLKSSSEHYEETKENLQKMCDSLDKISQTHHDLTDRIRQVLTEMEKANKENEKTRELIQSIYGEAKNAFETEIHRHETVIEESLSMKYAALSDELRKQSDRILQDNLKQSKAQRFTRYLMVVGIVLEVVIIIRIFLF